MLTQRYTRRENDKVAHYFSMMLVLQQLFYFYFYEWRWREEAKFVLGFAELSIRDRWRKSTKGSAEISVRDGWCAEPSNR